MNDRELKKAQNKARKEVTALCHNCEISKSDPPTHKAVLLKTWAQDTEAMASETIDSFYTDYFEGYELPDGFTTRDVREAVRHYVAYLNSASEVGK